MIGANQCPHGALRRSCEICELTAEREHLRAVNALLQEALEIAVGCMQLQRDVIDRGAYAKAWAYPINAAERALAIAKAQPNQE